MKHPNVVILAGPNGAGKSTLSEALLRDTLGIRHYVNADTLAADDALWEQIKRQVGP
jgi:predicted ABC-type ATPase